MTFDMKTAADAFVSNLTVIPATLGLALVILVLAIVLGMVLALIRLYKVPVLTNIATVFISFMRGVPLLVLLFIVYYSLPDFAASLGRLIHVTVDPNNVSPVYSVILTFSIYGSAFQAENIKGALLSVELGQMEAAYAVGMTTLQAFRRIIIPQALIVAVPNFCNAYVSTIKSLSLAFTVGVIDILAKAKLNAALNFRYIESYAAAALVYWILCIALTILFRKIEANLRRGRAEAAH